MRKAIPIFLFLVILFGVGGLILVRHMSRVHGPGYIPSRAMEKLRAIADSSGPFRNALERFKSDQGHYPAAVTNLVPSYFSLTNTLDLPNSKDWAGWEYTTRQPDS